MEEYNRWPKDELIRRLRQLDQELKTYHAAAALQPPDTTKPGQDGAEPPVVPTPDLDDGSEAKKKKKQKPSKANKTKSPMDPSKYATRFIALKFAYLGKNYNGLEYQPTGVMTTIEEELWKALVKACLIFPNPARPYDVDWSVCDYSKCGRTDRGVSAFGQVVALRVRSNKLRRKPAAAAAAAAAAAQEDEAAAGTAAEEEGQAEEEEEDDDDTPLPVEQEIPYPRTLNRLLPPDIRVYAWCPDPPADFSARFSCRERQYRYFFTQPAFSPLPSFLERDDTKKDNKPKEGWLDISAMRRAAKLFEGLHDFRNFCKIDPSKQMTSFVRRIYEADIVEVDDYASLPYLSGPQFQDDPSQTTTTKYPKMYYFHVRGTAFLWHQIRCMVAVLFLVGQGHEDAAVVTRLLDAQRTPRRPNYVLADDAPLVLWDCLFGRDRDEGEDQLTWVHDDPLALHGSSTGLAGALWAAWRARKMDELLAAQMAGLVAAKTGFTAEGEGEGTAVVKAGGRSAKVFEGGNGPRYVGDYTPIVEKEMLHTPEEMHDRYARRKGFKNSEEMRATGNWREVVRAAKNGGGGGGGGGGGDE